MLSRCTRFVNPTRRSCARFVSPSRRTFVSTFRSNSSINHGRTPIDPFELPKLILEQIPSKKVLTGVGLSAFGLFLLSESIFISDAGISYVQQNSLTGELAVYSKPGVHFRVPFFSNVTAYKQVITASFGEKEQSLFCTPDAVKVRFADTYTGGVPCTFRFRLSSDDESMRKIHKEFRSESNFAEKLLARNCKNVVIITATQYTGEEFFQGGLNEFKHKLEDQLKEGIYETERKQVVIETMDMMPMKHAPVNNPHKPERQQQMVWKTVNVVDKHGLPKRAETPLSQYGVTVSQVTVGDPKPENLLDSLLISKKKLVGARIKAVQEQETAKEQSKTEQLKKEIERTRAVQDAQREKELAIIGEQRHVEVAKQVAHKEKVEQNKLKELAVIDKTKELEIAKSNMEIYKANSDAALHEAKAIRAKGEAEAFVLAAKYRALGANKEIYLAEMRRDTAKLLYENLNGFNVQMPQNYINSGGGDAGRMTSNIDVITGLAALGVMESSIPKAVSNTPAVTKTGGWFA